MSVAISKGRYEHLHLLVKEEAPAHKPSIKCPCRPYYDKQAGLVIHRKVVTGGRSLPYAFRRRLGRVSLPRAFRGGDHQ